MAEEGWRQDLLCWLRAAGLVILLGQPVGLLLPALHVVPRVGALVPDWSPAEPRFLAALGIAWLLAFGADTALAPRLPPPSTWRRALTRWVLACQGALAGKALAGWLG